MHNIHITQKGQQQSMSFSQLVGQNPYTLLYFYPRDNTPGCTVEAQDFTRLQKEFATHDIYIVGVSKDSHESHCKFQEKQSLGIDLISDPDLSLHKHFGARGEKNNYGKIIQGVIRSTFLLNNDGSILHEWKNIRAKGHAERVLQHIQSTLHST